MKTLILTLSYLFSALEMLTAVLVFPLTVLCTLGLIGFTLKIARDMRAKGVTLEADPLAGRLGA